ncbi:unnamed protein product [Cyprideis torosa]|uniref:Uncharacterized protein n=1 Tax=Cyprideis torosa TaxID=163714 RepID=A0A7R8W9Z4_9CRUS|nr:unnamed protein product [Cyprideis torosa]CAG0887833.1 unnamed protein product [Cyprideis torosa]
MDGDVETLVKGEPGTSQSQTSRIILMPQDRSHPRRRGDYVDPFPERRMDYSYDHRRPPFPNFYSRYEPPPFRRDQPPPYDDMRRRFDYPLPPPSLPPRGSRLNDGSRAFQQSTSEIIQHLQFLVEEMGSMGELRRKYDHTVDKMARLESDIGRLETRLRPSTAPCQYQKWAAWGSYGGNPDDRGRGRSLDSDFALIDTRSREDRGPSTGVTFDPRDPFVPCRLGYVRIKRGCYYFGYRESLDWETAKRYCERDRAALAQMETIEEYQDILKHLSSDRDLKEYSYWVGARKDERTNTYRWEGGKLRLPDYLEAELGTSQLTDFAEIESHDQQCVMIDNVPMDGRNHLFKLRSKRCHIYERFICEY